MKKAWDGGVFHAWISGVLCVCAVIGGFSGDLSAAILFGLFGVLNSAAAFYMARNEAGTRNRNPKDFVSEREMLNWWKAELLKKGTRP